MAESDILTNGRGNGHVDETERQEWLESLEYVLHSEGREKAGEILRDLRAYALQEGIPVPLGLNTPYVNTIP